MQSPLIAALKIPSFFFLVVSEFFSQFAMNLLNFSLLIVAFQLSKSNPTPSRLSTHTVPQLLLGVIL